MNIQIKTIIIGFILCSAFFSYADDTGLNKEWKLQEDVGTYNRDTLCDYIDGAAELYFGYAFRSLDVSVYKRTGDDAGIAVEQYDMGSSQEAFGIYSMLREPDYQFIDLGNQACMSGFDLYIWHSRFFIHIQNLNAGEELNQDMILLGRDICSSVEPADTRPAILAQLPENARIANSERFMHTYLALRNIYFIPEGILKLDSGADAAWADYQAGADTWSILLISYKTEAIAINAEDLYVKHLIGSGYITVESDGIKGKALTKNGRYIICKRSGNLFIVLIDIKNLDVARGILEGKM